MKRKGPDHMINYRIVVDSCGEFTEDMKNRQETTLPAGTERMVSIQIQFRQHCSLQGFLICGKQKAGFRSALELLYLLEDCLQEQEKQDA